MKEQRKKLIKYVTPSVLSSLSIFLFTIIDGVFVGRGVGTNALGAVNIAFPFVMVFTALVMLSMVGGLTITSIRIGRGENEGANESFMHSLLFGAVISLVFCLAGVFFSKPIAALMGANETFLDMAAEYIFWYAVFLVPCGLGATINGFVRADGDPVLVSAGTIISTIINIVGDWLFIYPLHMGLMGAAIATGLAQTIGFFIVLSHFFKKNRILSIKKVKLKADLYGKIFVRGLPECIAQFGVPLGIILMNIMLVNMIGDVAVNAYSIIGYVASFSVAIFIGTAEGLQPLFGISYGEGSEKDLKYYLKSGLIISFIGSAVLTALVLLIREAICVLYGADPVTASYTVAAMPKYSWGFLVQSLNVIISAYLYSTTRSKQALIINVLRSLVVNSLIILLVPRILGAESIWFTFGIYESIVLIVAVLLLVNADKHGAIKAGRE